MFDFLDHNSEPTCSKDVTPVLPESGINAEPKPVCIETGGPSGSTTRLNLPRELLDPEIFFNVVSSKNFRNLQENEREKLTKLLPNNLQENELETFLDKFFDSDSKIGFVNPLKQFHDKLQNGFFDPENAQRINEFKACLKLRHEIKLREYYARLLKNLLIKRRQIFQAAKNCAEGDVINPNFEHQKTGFKKQKLQKRALKRSKIVLQSVKSQVGESNLSSDDEDLIEFLANNANNTQQMPNSNVVPQPKQHAGLSSPEDLQFSTLYNPTFTDLDLHQPTDMADIKTMLMEYKALLKSDQSEHPSLDFTDITLENVIERTGLALQQPKQSVRKSTTSTSSSNAKQSV